MLDLTESPSAKLLEPSIRLSIENAAADRCSSVKTVKLAHDLDDKTPNKLALQGDALLDRIVKCRALSLDDELWRRLPADFRNSGRVIESVTVDLEELRHLGAIPASGALPATPPPVDGGSALMRLVSPIARRLIEWRARVMQRRTLATLDDHMLKDIGLTRMDVEQETLKPFWRQ